MALTTDAYDAGTAAIQAGAWSEAAGIFGGALEHDDAPELHEGLGRARWWLQDIDGAIDELERAYAGYRERADARRAAGIALWLSREYAAVYGNTAAAAGWSARAEGLLKDLEPGAEHGWLALTRAERSLDPAAVTSLAAEALGTARGLGDADLEAAALARLGYGEVAAGDVEGGTAKLDEAMAAATGGEVRGPETIGEVTCVAIAAFELAADWQRIEQWGQVVDGWIRRNNHVHVLGFCSSCCAEMFVASGAWDQAEAMLTEGLGALQAAGHRARCVHPAAKLAELRLSQARIEEAEQLLAGYEELPEAAHAVVALHMARGETSLAAAALHRRLNAVGRETVLGAPFLSQLVEVQLAQRDVASAWEAALLLREVAERSGIARLIAAADLAAGRVAAVTGDPEAATHLGSALSRFAAQGMALDAARARLLIAEAAEVSEPEVAIGEARTALAEFERLGAPRDADAAAALLRRHGVRGRTGPKLKGELTRRELEVLPLLAEGLTNAEIAARLFLSTKTVGHHVSNILAKLGVKTRGEAGAWALRSLDGSPPQETRAQR